MILWVLKWRTKLRKKENICCLGRHVTSKNVFNKKFDSINVKNSEIFQVLKSEKNTIVYVAKKGWLNNMIWCSEMKKLDQTLGKEKRKILLLVHNCSLHKKVPKLQNIELLFIMPGSTSFLQVSSIKLNFRITNYFVEKIIIYSHSTPVRLQWLKTDTKNG